MKIIHETEGYPWTPLSQRENCCQVKKSAIKTKELTLYYGNKLAFKNINIEFSQGCITGLVGPSGCGKTSFLMCLNRLIEMVPEAKMDGIIEVEGENILKSTISLRELRKSVGMIFQKPNPFPTSIRKNILLPIREHGLAVGEDVNVLMQNALEDVGLWREVKDRLDESALSLSGGQQQRLCIARALVLKPRILLMDEPCSALDPISSGVVEDLIQDLRGHYTVVVVTHNLAQARRISDYVGFFWVRENFGELVEYGNAQQVFENPKEDLTAAYIHGVRG